MLKASNINNLLRADRLLTFQRQHERKLGFLVLDPELNSVSPSTSTIKRQIHHRKRKEKSKFSCYSHKNFCY